MAAVIEQRKPLNMHVLRHQIRLQAVISRSNVRTTSGKSGTSLHMARTITIAGSQPHNTMESCIHAPFPKTITFKHASEWQEANHTTPDNIYIKTPQVSMPKQASAEW